MKISVIFPDFPKEAPDIVSPGFKMPRDGLLYIASVLKYAGHDVALFFETMEKIDWKEVLSSDVVCFSLMSANSRRGFEMAKMVKEKIGVPVIMGGPFPTFSAEECLDNHCDIVVRREGEETIVELIDVLEKGKNWKDIKGIAYLEEGKIIVTPDRPYISHFNIKYDPTLIRGLNKNNFEALLEFIRTGRARINFIPISITRGCPFNCTFCYAVRMCGNRHRKKDIPVVIEEIKSVLKLLPARRFVITDINFTADNKYCKELLKEIIKNKFNCTYVAMARIEVAEDEELLDLLYQAGVQTLYVGFEGISEDTLRLYDKKRNLSKTIEYVQKIHKKKIDIVASFVAGADTDTKESIRNIYDFAIKMDFYRAYIFALCEIPYVQLHHNYQQLVPDYRIMPEQWKNFIGTMVGFFPKRMKPSTLQREMQNGYFRLLSRRRILGYLSRLQPKKAIYQWFFRNSALPAVKYLKNYFKYLEEIEQGYYDEKEELIEDKLKEDYEKRRNIFRNLAYVPTKPFVFKK
jgi:radical SAM superfamily enzyme YgiQ (UPF0313 family)